ncbi:MAG: 3-phosphoshikimate 1-carboxyvinyltransferase, partial [Paramuribaculum sp.]|nr:3-phosphoshikimate 1-carboxyvinyltransferase [Paramuribaculum sp.]
GWPTLKGLHEKSCQGDSAIVELFRGLGVETGFEESPLQAVLEASPDLAPRFVADLSSTPDVAQTFAVTCSMLGVPFRLSGLRSLRIKETDRIAALYNELLKVGVILETEGDEVISWDGIRRPVSEIPAFDTYSDHRMALSLAPAAIFIPGIIINDAEVVTKSYPGYWDDLRKAGFTVEEYTAEAE